MNAYFFSIFSIAFLNTIFKKLKQENTILKKKKQTNHSFELPTCKTNSQTNLNSLLSNEANHYLAHS